MHGFARTAFRLVALQFGYYRLRYFFFKVIVPKRKCSRCTKEIEKKKDALDDKIVWDAGKLRKTTKLEQEKMSTNILIDDSCICRQSLYLF